jgi:hypothetical protein
VTHGLRVRFNMSQTQTILERAFILAASGTVASLDDLRTQLKAEGFHGSSQLTGRSLNLQLSRLIAKSKLNSGTTPP